MEKRVVLAVVLTMLVVLLLGLYMNFEPERQAAAAQRQREEAMERGMTLFATLCTGCHGVQGEGRVGPKLAGGAFLERRGLQQGDTSSMRLAEKQMRKSISRGVTKTAMPAWGVEEGGSLNEEQILQIATLLLYGGDDAWEQVAAAAPKPVRASQPAATAVPGAPEPGSAPPRAADLAAQGRQVYQSVGCAACHGPNAEGAVGPALVGVSEARIEKQVRNPGGGIMPAFPPDRLSDDEIRALAAFVDSLVKK